MLRRLGVERAVVVHGGGGLDELSLEGENKVSILKDGKITSFTFKAADLGLVSATKEALKGDTPAENARTTENILKGIEQGPKSAVVLLNAAAALLASDLVSDLKEGIALAQRLISEGKAYAKLEQLRARSRAILIIAAEISIPVPRRTFLRERRIVPVPHPASSTF